MKCDKRNVIFITIIYNIKKNLSPDYYNWLCVFTTVLDLKNYHRVIIQKSRTNTTEFKNKTRNT